MKNEIHPNYVTTTVTCGCGETFQTRSTIDSGSLFVEVCSVCHPFYTGKQRILDTGGRVAKFQERLNKATTKKQLLKRRPHPTREIEDAVFFSFTPKKQIEKEDRRKE